MPVKINNAPSSDKNIEPSEPNVKALGKSAADLRLFLAFAVLVVIALVVLHFGILKPEELVLAVLVGALITFWKNTFKSVIAMWLAKLSKMEVHWLSAPLDVTRYDGVGEDTYVRFHKWKRLSDFFEMSLVVVLTSTQAWKGALVAIRDVLGKFPASLQFLLSIVALILFFCWIVHVKNAPKPD